MNFLWWAYAPAPYLAIQQAASDNTCTDCGHLLAHHDSGWCYSCRASGQPCAHQPPATEAPSGARPKENGHG